jgi:hypothetical protein
MVQELLPLLPTTMTTAQVVICLMVLLSGVVLWLTGTAWSRSFLTLLAVAIGGTLGMLVPRWQLWPINSMSAAVLGAVGLGVSAFLLERMWVGLTLGFVLAMWASLGTWMLCRGDAVWQAPEQWETQFQTPPQQAQDIWSRMPAEVQKVAPYATGMAMFSGLAMAMLWPRAARVLCHSVLGVTIIFTVGLALMLTQRTEWLQYLPVPVISQIGLLAGLVMIGILAQWQLIAPSPQDEHAVANENHPMHRPAGRFV